VLARYLLTTGRVGSTLAPGPVNTVSISRSTSRSTSRSSRFLALLALTVLAACSKDSITEPGRPEPPPHYPIIFVHGFLGDSTTWSSTIARFKADGWTDRELVNWRYDYNQSNVAIAQQLAAKVDSVLAATGAKHVSLITHSMGSLSARYYARNLIAGSDTSTRVDAIVSLAGTNHGTSLAAFCGSISCQEMRPGSAFLTALNAGDETWGTPRYATWWSPCDEAVLPQTSAILNGAQNTETACISHSGVYQSQVVYEAVREFVRPTRYGR
jgi:triacylglycerol lipase